ncbi:hypothetical protein [Nitrosomonas sp. Nm166]|uniref:hypothetical protein n=1 Tax=Nitrosomonas sp. Nm166 TaxID=1881054 RepID=UPI0008EEDA0C|nr:hypothetical protein [Nitrosomonas sp. Nm166]SFE99474.1 hypothetical protein SAMN05428977_104123 [Nitrosomonas sp. Nm166]
MRTMRILRVVLVSFFFQENVFGTAIVYNGFECRSAISANDITPTDIPVQSRFEVIEDVGDGVFRLSLTGGIPRFINNNPNVCIDSATAIGYSGIPDVDGLPKRRESIDATAYFNGRELVIVVSSMFTDLSARREPLSSFNTSLILPITNTLIFQFNPQAFLFSLKKIIHNRGFTHTSGATNSIIPFRETVLPSFNEIPQDTPRILTPASSIEYTLE